MNQKYTCPVCRENHTDFEIIYRLIQKIRKDPETGKVIYASDILETPAQGRKPELEIRCAKCGYTARERLFVQAALREEQAVWTRLHRR